MKLVIISDTHGHHEALGTLSGDVLIHCGDMESLFNKDVCAIANMDNWFGRQQFDHVLCTGGNHDLAIEQQIRLGNHQPFRNATFLNDAGLTLDGVKFYGAPWVPDLAHHAFYADDAALKVAWSKIPNDVDVLLTHTPPAGMLDVSSRGLTLGCPHLRKRLGALRPTVHCFGHVHASAGQRKHRGVTYINATSVDSSFEIAHPPYVIEVSQRTVRSTSKSWWG